MEDWHRIGTYNADLLHCLYTEYGFHPNPCWVTSVSRATFRSYCGVSSLDLWSLIGCVAFKIIHTELRLFSRVTSRSYVGLMDLWSLTHVDILFHCEELMSQSSTATHDGVMKQFCATGHLCGEFTGNRWIPSTQASNAELIYFLWSTPEPTVEQTLETPVIWDAIAVIMTPL